MSSFPTLRAQVSAFIGTHWVFGEVCKPITIPREAIDASTGDINHYYGEARELRTGGVSGRAMNIWFKKKDRGYDLRLGPAVVRRCTDARSIPAMRDILVGEVERSDRGRGDRAKYIGWHCNAGPVFVLASFLDPRKPPIDPGQLRSALQLPHQEAARDDLWLIARLALFPGGVEDVIRNELEPDVNKRSLRVTDDSPLRFAYQLAFHFHDAELHAALVAAAQAAGVTSTAPPRTKRARAATETAIAPSSATPMTMTIYALELCV